MKSRLGFVSNSSSSSFVIANAYLSEEQRRKLIEVCATPVGEWEDSWSVQSDDYYVRGFTCMNNGYGEGGGGLEDWMRENEFPMGAIMWDDN